ncbi:hypothetical protein DB345_02640 [Spartobacteria bacterium LR76]|nr:hypothetical protein DB345_02640 [Spartobacteria bacterium LR76]
MISPCKTTLLLSICLVMSQNVAHAQTVPLRAYCYSLPSAEALAFILAHNPTGQPGESVDALNSLVKEKKAALAASAAVSVPPGQRESLTKGDLSLDAEITPSADRSAYAVTCQTSYKGANIMGRSLLAPNQFAFFGLIPNTSDPDSVLLIYLLISDATAAVDFGKDGTPVRAPGMPPGMSIRNPYTGQTWTVQPDHTVTLATDRQDNHITIQPTKDPTPQQRTVSP